MRHGRHFAAPDVARFCDVDLKTVHAWAKKGALLCDKSAGGQLRFRRTDVVSFLRGQGFPLPKAITRERPVVLCVGALGEALLDALREETDVHQIASPVRALVGLRELGPDALVLGATLGFSRAVLVRELAATEPRLVQACMGTLSAEALALRDVGAAVVGLEGDETAFVRALGEVLGLVPPAPPLRAARRAR